MNKIAQNNLKVEILTLIEDAGVKPVESIEILLDIAMTGTSTLKSFYDIE